MYTVDYGTGVGNFSTETFEEAEKKAVEGMTYTQEDVRIFDENGNPAEVSYWRNGEPTEETALVQFGSYGYYSEWYGC